MDSPEAGGRLAINASPEPVTNITASVVEDVAVLGVVWFAVAHPRTRARKPRSPACCSPPGR